MLEGHQGPEVRGAEAKWSTGWAALARRRVRAEIAPPARPCNRHRKPKSNPTPLAKKSREARASLAKGEPFKSRLKAKGRVPPSGSLPMNAIPCQSEGPAECEAVGGVLPSCDPSLPRSLMPTPVACSEWPPNAQAGPAQCALFPWDSGQDQGNAPI